MSLTPDQHATYSPSSAHRWMHCPGSVAATAHIPRTTNKFADEGTAAHELAACCLSEGRDPWDFELYEMHIYDGKCCTNIKGNIEVPADYKDHSMWEVDQAMIEYIQEFINVVNDFMQVKDAVLLVEQRVDFSAYLPVNGQYGTSDVVILTSDEIIVIDLKYGRGVVVNAEENEQLMLYALGAYKTFETLGDFKRVRMVIHQPRVQHLSEWDCSIDELMKFAEQAGHAVNLAQAAITTEGDGLFLFPGKKQCQWCPVKHDCPALTNHVLATVTDEDFQDMTSEQVSEAVEEASQNVHNNEETRLSFFMDQVALIEGWCKAVRAATLEKLTNGEQINGYKLVRGRKGARKWTDESQVEQILVKSMKLKHDQAYKKKLIAPATAEKILKKSKKRWNRLQPFITQGEGSLSVAPSEDKRPAVDLTELDMEDLSSGGLL